MRLRFKVFALLAVVFPALAYAQDPFRLKPGAKGKLCLECHATIQETVDLPFVHTPVKAGNCSDCHNPHASSHGQLLDDDVDSLCLDCHGDILPEGNAGIHQAVTDGGCVSCHDAHASGNPANLVAASVELCYTCHEDIAAQLEQQRFKHAPVAKSCLTCHNPHASMGTESLLKADMSTLCGDCHDTGQASFVERHMGYPVAGSRCSSCHDPHGSNRSGILLNEVHAPLTNKMCNQCHMDPGSSSPLGVRADGIDLCRGCHADAVNEAFSKNRLHWPMADDTACLNCHSPHASTENALLLEPTETLCATCHPDVMTEQAASVTKHEPVEQGKCSACHAPHASDNVFLMHASNVNDLCGTCHDWKTHSSHPIGGEVVDQRNMNLTVDCSSCHRPHGSPFKAFAHADPGGDLCLQCHQDLSR